MKTRMKLICIICWLCMAADAVAQLPGGVNGNAGYFRLKNAIDSAQKATILTLQNDSSLRVTTHPTMENLERNIRRSTLLYEAKLKVLHTYRGNIDEATYALFYNDIAASLMERRYRMLRHQYASMQQRGISFAQNWFQPLLDGDTVALLPVGYALSETCLQALVNKTATIALLRTNRQLDYRPLYNELRGLYCGPSAEALITWFLLKADRTASTLAYEACVQDALSWLTFPPYKDDLEEQLSRMRRGANAFPFRLRDTTGKQYTLKDFAGKVLVIDCWFTGCSACKALAADIRAVMDTFRNDSRVAFLSISVDKQRDRWLKSVRSGEYSHPGSVNLFTGGSGEADPFIRHYEFTSFPRQLLIDPEGKVFDVPPRPETAEKRAMFIQLVRQALE